MLSEAKAGLIQEASLKTGGNISYRRPASAAQRLSSSRVRGPYAKMSISCPVQILKYNNNFQIEFIFRFLGGSMGRTRIEGTLKREIQEMKGLRKYLFERMQEASRYEHQAGKALSHRWSKRYAFTAARLLEEIQQLKSVFLRQGEELERKIIEERKISEQEIKDFQAQLEREVQEYKEAQKNLQTLEQANALRDDPEKLKKVEAAKIKEKKEKKDVDKVRGELVSEARDERLFLEAMHQILTDRNTLQES
jgi:hypothetical protein